MYDLILHGNVFNDTIFKLVYDKLSPERPNPAEKVIHTQGGIANHLKTIQHTKLNLKVGFNCILEENVLQANGFNNPHFDFLGQYNKNLNSEAVILIDNQNRKTSSVFWGCDTQLLDFDIVSKPFSKWHHFVYLDALPYLSHSSFQELSYKKSTISIDLCGGFHNFDKDILDYVDFIIISDDEKHLIDPKYFNKAIIHSPTGTKFKTSYIKNRYELDTDICILGAGDAYSVSFISEYLKTYSIEKSVEFAHANACEYLKLQNKSYEKI